MGEFKADMVLVANVKEESDGIHVNSTIEGNGCAKDMMRGIASLIVTVAEEVANQMKAPIELITDMTLQVIKELIDSGMKKQTKEEAKS